VRAGDCRVWGCRVWVLGVSCWGCRVWVLGVSCWGVSFWWLLGLAGLPLVALHGFVKGLRVVAAKKSHSATAVNAVGVVDAHHEANIAIAVVAPLLLRVELVVVVRDIDVAAVVRHERCRAIGLPSLLLPLGDFRSPRCHRRKSVSRRCVVPRMDQGKVLPRCDGCAEQKRRLHVNGPWHRDRPWGSHECDRRIF
jgi:hypothetical protein